LPARGPEVRWPPAGFEFEARAWPRPRSLILRRVALGLHTLLAFFVLRFNIPVGGFDPRRYRRELVENTDFRKYDDGLRMTLDCTADMADRLEARLEQASAAGVSRHGVHRQSAALMTCIVPSPTRSDHVHFVDGADGGYAAAARALKQGAGQAEVRPAPLSQLL
jgi:hypothetical protein